MQKACELPSNPDLPHTLRFEVIVAVFWDVVLHTLVDGYF
jgi:hypothetical protein